MTIKDRILEYLRTHPDGADDDQLAEALDLRARQQANQRCRELQADGLVARQRVGGKIRSFWAGAAIPDTDPVQEPHTTDETRPWYWEGNVQARVVEHLARAGCQIRSVADTASRQRGVDIVAERGERALWVSVKGYPNGTPRTNPSVQAAHWFKHAIFDILEYRGQDQRLLLAVAIPDFPRYRSLAAKIAWLQPVADYSYFWVNENGNVSENTAGRVNGEGGDA